MIKLPVGTLPVDFLTLFMLHFRNLAGKTRRARSRYEVREKEIAFLQGNFDNVRKNYCFAVHKGDAESLTDMMDKCLIFTFLQCARLKTIKL